LIDAIQLLHQARFATSSIVTMNDALFGGAVQVTNGCAYSSFGVRVFVVDSLASFGDLCFYK